AQPAVAGQGHRREPGLVARAENERNRLRRRPCGVAEHFRVAQHRGADALRYGDLLLRRARRRGSDDRREQRAGRKQRGGRDGDGGSTAAGWPGNLQKGGLLRVSPYLVVFGREQVAPASLVGPAPERIIKAQAAIPGEMPAYDRYTLDLVDVAAIAM